MEDMTLAKTEGQTEGRKASGTNETAANTTNVRKEDQDKEVKDNIPLKICHLRQTGQVFTPVELIKAYTALSKERTGIDHFPEDRFRVHVLNDLRAGHLLREGQGKDVRLFFDPYHPYNYNHKIMCGTSPDSTCRVSELPRFLLGLDDPVDEKWVRELQAKGWA
jgi:hypothetical protein